MEGARKSSRDFLYIDDAVGAIYDVIQFADEPETYNVSQGYDVNIKTLHKMVAEIAGYKKEIIWTEKQTDIKERTFLNIGLIRKDIGWNPKTNLEEGLRKTMEWHDQNLKVSLLNPDTLLVR